jgi:hypothetical protein
MSTIRRKTTQPQEEPEGDEDLLSEGDDVVSDEDDGADDEDVTENTEPAEGDEGDENATGTKTGKRDLKMRTNTLVHQIDTLIDIALMIPRLDSGFEIQTTFESNGQHNEIFNSKEFQKMRDDAGEQIRQLVAEAAKRKTRRGGNSALVGPIVLIPEVRDFFLNKALAKSFQTPDETKGKDLLTELKYLPKLGIIPAQAFIRLIHNYFANRNLKISTKAKGNVKAKARYAADEPMRNAFARVFATVATIKPNFSPNEINNSDLSIIRAVSTYSLKPQKERTVKTKHGRQVVTTKEEYNALEVFKGTNQNQLDIINDYKIYSKLTSALDQATDEEDIEAAEYAQSELDTFVKEIGEQRDTEVREIQREIEATTATSQAAKERRKTNR